MADAAADRASREAPAARKLPPLLRPHGGWGALGLLAALASAAFRVAVVPVFVTPLFDRVLSGGELSALPRVLLLAGGLVLLGSLALWLQDAALGRLAALTASRWRRGLYRLLLARPPGRLPGTSGGLASRVLADLREVEAFVQFGMGTLVAESAAVLGIVAVLLSTNLPATLLLLLLTLPLLALLRWLGGRLERASSHTQEGLEALGGHLQEGLRHHEVVRAFEADAFMLARLAPDDRATRRHSSRRSALAALQTPLAQILVFVAVGVLVTLLARAVAAERMSAGEVVAYVTLVVLLSTPAQLLPKGYALLQQARAAATRLRALADEPASEREDAATATPPESLASPEVLAAAEAADPAKPPGERAGAPSPRRPASPRLSLHGVRFRYPDDPRPRLQGVRLTLDGPALVGVAGDSGAGKTTLLRLMLGFLQPEAGEVRLGGRPLARIPAAELRRRLAYVPQGFGLLSGSLRDNLLLGRPLPEARLWEALEGVDLAEVVAALPAGLEQPLGEDGGGLSGGQLQRLAVARALLGDPEVVVLDEPTANLDEASEAALVALLQQQARTRLVVAVAHRPALLAVADRVVRVAGGAVTLPPTNTPSTPATPEPGADALEPRR